MVGFREQAIRGNGSLTLLRNGERAVGPLPVWRRR